VTHPSGPIIVFMNLLAKILPGAAAYPDIHPMLVHFPAALFPVALFFALLSIWKSPEP